MVVFEPTLPSIIPNIETPPNLNKFLRILHNANTKFPFTDHILLVEWNAQQGWARPQITPYQPISLDPTASVFNYGFSCFEGMKAYKDDHGRVRLFRPDMNLDRFNASAARIGLPGFDGNELLKLMAKFVEVESRFIYG